MDEKYRGVIIEVSGWDGKNQQTGEVQSMVKISVLDIDRLQIETYHKPTSTLGSGGLPQANSKAVVEVVTEMAKSRVGNTYHKRLVSLTPTGETLTMKVSKT